MYKKVTILCSVVIIGLRVTVNRVALTVRKLNGTETSASERLKNQSFMFASSIV